MNIILQTGHTGGGKDTKRKTVDCLLCSLGPHKERPTRSTKTYQDHERKLQKQMVSDPRRNLLDQSGKARVERLTFWDGSHAIILNNSELADCIFKWWALKVMRSFSERVIAHFNTRRPAGRKNTRKCSLNLRCRFQNSIDLPELEGHLKISLPILHPIVEFCGHQSWHEWDDPA